MDSLNEIHGFGIEVSETVYEYKLRCLKIKKILIFIKQLSFLFLYFPVGILGLVWYLIVSIPDLCPLSYFYNPLKTNRIFHKV